MLDKQNFKNHLKLLLIMLGAFVFSSVLSKTIFLASTPRINKVFIAKVINLPGTLMKNTNTFIANLGKPSLTVTQKSKLQEFERLPLTALKPVASGVYAKDDLQNNIVYIKMTSDMQFDEQVMTINGKQVKVRFPKGTFTK